MKNLFTLFLILCTIRALSQTPLANLVYMDEITGGGLMRESYPAVDHENNFILGGTYLNHNNKSIVVQGDTILTGLNPSGDVVVFKFNPVGDLIWMKRVASSKFIYLDALVVDKTGHIILRFTNEAPATFGNVTLAPGTTLLKLDPDGAYEWHNTLSGLDFYYYHNRLSLDCFDNIVIGGNTTLHDTDIAIDTMIWPPDTIIQYQQAPDSIGLNGVLFPPAGYQNMVLMKFLPDGSPTWLKQFPANAFLSEISAEFGSDIVLIGKMADDTLVLDNVTLVKSDTAAYDEVFYAKVSEEGMAVWARTNFTNTSPWDIRLAPDGSVYASASFYLSTTYQNTTIQSNGYHDVLLLKLDSSGALQWARGIGNASTNQVGTLTVNKNGDVAIAIDNTNSIDMGRKYDAQGNLLWINPDAGDLGNNGTLSMAFAPDGSMWVSGWFNGDFSMGPYEFSIWGGPDYIFMAKFSDQDIQGPLYTCMQTGATSTAQAQEEAPVRLAPNPAGASVEISGPMAFSTIRIFSVDGKLLTRIDPAAEPTLEVDLSGFEPGLLFIECVDQNGKRTVQKLVKL